MAAYTKKHAHIWPFCFLLEKIVTTLNFVRVGVVIAEFTWAIPVCRAVYHLAPKASYKMGSSNFCDVHIRVSICAWPQYKMTSVGSWINIRDFRSNIQHGEVQATASEKVFKLWYVVVPARRLEKANIFAHFFFSKVSLFRDKIVTLSPKLKNSSDGKQVINSSICIGGNSWIILGYKS